MRGFLLRAYDATHRMGLAARIAFSRDAVANAIYTARRGELRMRVEPFWRQCDLHRAAWRIAHARRAVLAPRRFTPRRGANCACAHRQFTGRAIYAAARRRSRFGARRQHRPCDLHRATPPYSRSKPRASTAPAICIARRAVRRHSPQARRRESPFRARRSERLRDSRRAAARIAHARTASSPAERFTLPRGADRVLAPGASTAPAICIAQHRRTVSRSHAPVTPPRFASRNAAVQSLEATRQ
jgi:hypothetical protein